MPRRETSSGGAPTTVAKIACFNRNIATRRTHIEHILSKQHGGLDDVGNLALACHRCNLRKGPNLTGIDPATGELVPLFHPRRDEWDEHFLFRGVRIEGRTPAGRATVRLLAMNEARRLELRSELQASGLRPH